MQRQCTAALLRFEGDAQPEDRREFAFERYGVRVTWAPLRGWCFGAALDEPLGGAHVEPAAHDLCGERDWVRRGKQGAGMPGRQFAVIEAALPGLHDWVDEQLARNGHV